MQSNAIRILMVDNDEKRFALLKEEFAQDSLFAHSIDYASSFAECMEKTTSNIYDILIIRFLLRSDKKNGMNLVYQLRHKSCKTPAILLTEDEAEPLCTTQCTQNSVSRCVPKSEQSAPLLISIIFDTILHFKKTD